MLRRGAFDSERPPIRHPRGFDRSESRKEWAINQRGNRRSTKPQRAKPSTAVDRVRVLRANDSAELPHLLSGRLAGGPLLLPGRPLMFDVSCCCTAGFCWFEPDPTVSPGFAAGPFLLPGWPATPAPEFCVLDALLTFGVVL